MAVIQSPLARSLQGGLIQSRVSGGIFGGGGLRGAGSSGVDEDENKQLLQNNQSTLFDIASGINGLRIQMASLNEALNSIAIRISNDATLESIVARSDEDYQRKLLERQVRVGQESALESKIQAALTKPVVALQSKVSSIFGNVGNALQTLFLGWFLNQGLEALQANAQGNKEKLTSIKNEVLKALAFIVAGGGVLSVIKASVFGLTRSLLGLSSRIGAFVISGLFIRPFQMVINAIQGMWNKVTGAKPPAAPPPSVKPPGTMPEGEKPPKPKGGKPMRGGGLVGGLVNLAYGGLNFMERKNEGQSTLEAAGGAATTVGGAELGGRLGGLLPGPLRIPGMIAGSILGGMGAGGLYDMITGANKPQRATAKTEPMQTPMGALVPSAYAPPTALPSEEINILPMSLAPTPTTEEKPKPKPKEKETIKPAATTKPAKSVTPMMTAAAETKPAETKPADVAPAQTTPIPKETPNVGPAEKPKPVINVSTVGTQKSQPPSVGTNNPVSQVPNISSSNPDNFYALFSQLNYNVVM